jgi:uncharacterized protein YceK
METKKSLQVILVLLIIVGGALLLSGCKSVSLKVETEDGGFEKTINVPQNVNVHVSIDGEDVIGGEEK